MKILILNYEYPPLGGGGGIISQYIAEGLSKEHDVTVLSTWYSGLLEDEIVGGLRIVRVRSRRSQTFRSNPIEMLSWARLAKLVFRDTLSKERFDICLANFVMPGGEVARYLKIRFGLPYMLLSHGHDIPWVKPYVTLFPLHAMSYYRLKKICKESVGIFVQTNIMKINADKFVGLDQTSKVTVIPNGCGVALSPKEKEMKSGLRIIFVGRMVQQKAPLIFVKALKILNNYCSEFTVSMYGDGPLRPEVENLVQTSGLAERVRVFGKVPHAEVMKAYEKAHVMVAPSISEGMSISMLEALAMGVYLITTDVSGAPDMIESKLNGEIVPLNDQYDIAEQLNRYYRDRYLVQYTIPMGFLNVFQMKYSWDNIVKEYSGALKAGMNLTEQND